MSDSHAFEGCDMFNVQIIIVIRLTFSMLGLVGRFLHMRPLHLSRSKAYSACKPNSTKFFFTQSSKDFIPCLYLLLHKFQRFNMLIIMNLSHHVFKQRSLVNTFIMRSMPSQLLSSTQAVLLFQWKPHNHLTVIRSVLSNLAISSTFIAQD